MLDNFSGFLRSDQNIGYLRIVDTNTTGMHYDVTDPKSAFNAFISEGIVSKPNGAGGAFGFGKAVFCFHQLVPYLFRLRQMTKLTLKVSQNFVPITLKTVTTYHLTASMTRTEREKSLLMRPKFQNISVLYRKVPPFLFSESNTSVKKLRTS